MAFPNGEKRSPKRKTRSPSWETVFRNGEELFPKQGTHPPGWEMAFPSWEELFPAQETRRPSWRTVRPMFRSARLAWRAALLASQLPPKRLVQHRRQQRGQLGLGGLLQAAKRAFFVLEVFDENQSFSLYFQRWHWNAGLLNSA